MKRPREGERKMRRRREEMKERKRRGWVQKNVAQKRGEGEDREGRGRCGLQWSRGER